MLRWTGERDGHGILGFGLEEENIKRLKAGQPIIASFGISSKGGEVEMCDLIIHYGTRAELEELASGGMASRGQSDDGDVRDIGPTGNFPDGKISADDTGEVVLGVAIDPSGLLRIDFGASVNWLAMPRGKAREFAALLLKFAGTEGLAS